MKFPGQLINQGIADLKSISRQRNLKRKLDGKMVSKNKRENH